MSGKVKIVSWCFLTSLLGLGGCFDPPNGLLQCAAGDKRCPDGYECAANDRCYKRGQVPTFADMSMSMPEPDLAVPKTIKLHGQACDPATDACDGGEPCIDGVCCESACADPCKACNVDGQLGSCVPVPAGKQPAHGSCNMQSASTCGHDGTCDGAGVCALYAAGTACGTGACDQATGDFQPAPECDGKGVCQTLAGFNCNPYKCKDATSCFGPPCSSAAECAGTNSCTNMSCGLLALGRDCTNDNQCSAGHCVDGVCCESTCTGQCSACDLATGTGKGHCQQVSGTPRGTRTACTAAGTTCGGTCGSKLDACDYPDAMTACGSSCTNATTVNAGLCSGAGACTFTQSACPNHLACVGTTCKTQCAVDTDCDSRYFCNTITKQCVSKCTNATQDNGETDVDCGGPNCAPCAADKSCGVGPDCVSGVCSNAIGGRCRQAFGPPGWDVLSGASMNYGRAQHQLVMSKGKLYAIGGMEWYDYSGGPLVRGSRSYEVYTPSYLTSTNGLGSWALGPNPTSDLAAATVDPGAVTLADGTIHIAGGWAPGAPNTDLNVHSYLLPPATTFTTGTNFYNAVSGLRAAIASDGFAYFVGGGRAPDTAFACVNQVVKLTPPNTWTAVTSMGTGTRCNFAFAPDATGRLYAFFGRNATNGTTGLTGYASWKPGDANWVVNSGGISGMGYYNSGALGSDGRIYLFGGETGGAAVAADRRFLKYNEAAGFIFMPTPPGGFPLSRSATALGPDGRIYVNGGVGSVTGTPTPSEYTWVWGPKITVSTVNPTVNSTVFVTLKNFAANATVNLYWDSTAGPPITSTPALTDAMGNYAGTIGFVVPLAGASSVHKIIAMDPKSEYPVWAIVTVF